MTTALPAAKNRCDGAAVTATLRANRCKTWMVKPGSISGRYITMGMRSRARRRRHREVRPAAGQQDDLRIDAPQLDQRLQAARRQLQQAQRHAHGIDAVHGSRQHRVIGAEVSIRRLPPALLPCRRPRQGSAARGHQTPRAAGPGRWPARDKYDRRCRPPRSVFARSFLRSVTDTRPRRHALHAQHQADAHHHHRQRRAAEADEGQGHAGRGDGARHDGDVEQ